ncbi:hypothetical protein Dimus_034856 [Dionaea muscipula]
MADGDSTTDPQGLVCPPIAAKKENPSKFYSHFLFKALIATAFLLLVPLQAPDFIDQSLFTRSWELLHLVFVGIAVSYGLFSRRNIEDSVGDTNSKFDSAQSYLSRLLHVSSVFDEDVDGPSGSSVDDSKIQTWSSQYYRNNDPMVVVAEGGGSPVDGRTDSKSGFAEKPLLLPVRSLKLSRVPHGNDAELDNGVDSRVYRSHTLKSRVVDGDGDGDDDDDEFGYCSSHGVGGSISSSMFKHINGHGSSKSRAADAADGGNSGSSVSRSSSNASSMKKTLISGDFAVSDVEEMEERTEEDSVVLPSPIPWRSRSLRMEERKKDHIQAYEPRRSFGSQTSWFPASESPRKKSLEDEEEMARKYLSSPPPPPPPPPPPQKWALSGSIGSSFDNGLVSSHRNLKRSVWSEPKDYDQVKSQTELAGKSVRTIRAGETIAASSRTASRNGENGTVNMGMRRSKEAKTLMKPNRSASTTPTPSPYLVVKAHYVDDDDDDDGDESEAAKSMENGNSNGVSDEGPDVDKKADEFIAKFREQIRLQRIDSIKRSTGQQKRES